jgi:hypothetical protein
MTILMTRSTGRCEEYDEVAQRAAPRTGAVNLKGFIPNDKVFDMFLDEKKVDQDTVAGMRQ